MFLATTETIKENNDENHKKKCAPATTETIKEKTATETSPKNTKTMNRSIYSKVLDPPAAAESTKQKNGTCNGNH